MDFKEAIEFIKMVGFPAFVCIWFMLRTDRKLDKLADLIAKQNDPGE